MRLPRPPTKSSSSRPPVALAVTGGIGAGKSEALAAFARHGAPVLSSDDVVHRLLREDAEVRAALSERFGEDVIGPGGDVDRAALAGRVFGDAEELGWLERLLHPRVRGAYLAWREQLAALPEPPPVCVVEVPLLYETGADERFDVVVVITAPGELRAARARVPPDERSSRLIPDDEKVRRADFVYVNDGTLEELDAFVADVLERVAPSA